MKQQQPHAKIFIVSHPTALLLYKNLITIIRHHQDSPIILIKLNHPYFDKFNFTPYAPYFDTVLDLPYVTYKKNIIAGLLDIHTFKTQWKKSVAPILKQFQTFDLILERSAWLGPNIAFYTLVKKHKPRSILAFFMDDYSAHEDTARDPWRTLFTRIYRLCAPCFAIYALKRKSSGKFVDFSYAQTLPGKSVKIVNPARVTSHAPDEMPFPIIRSSQSSKKDTVIIFGDAGIIDFFKEYLLDKDVVVKKLEALFLRIKQHYASATLCYKPHPSDGDKIMPGIPDRDVQLLNNSMNAQEILEQRHESIKAAYTFSSSSVVWSSFFGVPSYTFYKYLCNEKGVKRFDSLFMQKTVVSPLLCHVSALSDVGAVDAVDVKINAVDLEADNKKYKRILFL